MSRAAFEAWAKPRHIQLDRDPDWPDKYVNEYVQSMWNGWQAATARAEGVVDAARALEQTLSEAEWDESRWKEYVEGQYKVGAAREELRQALASWEEGK